MKRFSIFIFIFIAILIFMPKQLNASQVFIDSYASLVDNSFFLESSFLSLKPEVESSTNYIVSTPVNIRTQPYFGLVIEHESITFQAENGSLTKTLFSLTNLTIKLGNIISEGTNVQYNSPGSFYLVSGISLNGTLSQEGGKITASGGNSNINSIGIETFDFTQADGLLIATGGTAANRVGHAGTTSTGLYIRNTLIQESGEIIALGGTAIPENSSSLSAHGIDVTFNLVQNDGIIKATGGASGNASSANGIRVSYGNLTQNGGTIIATGGSHVRGGNSAGIYIKDGTLTQNNGTIIATGSKNNDGICIDGKIMLEDGIITATTSSGDDITGNGIVLLGSLIQNGGIINVSANEGTGTKSTAHGLSVVGYLTQNGGIINSKGGTGTGHVDGISAQRFTLNGGTLTTTGGNVSQIYDPAISNRAIAHGVNCSISFTINSGVLFAYGGDGSGEAYGLKSGVEKYAVFKQNGGSVTAKGGKGSGNNHGISTGLWQQNNGLIHAEGGTGSGYSCGIRIVLFIQNCGGLFVSGGSGSGEVYGVKIFEDLIQNNGSIIASGGSTLGEAHGIYVGRDLIQNNGSIIAYGGGDTGKSHGINVKGDLIQNNGSIIAYGGDIMSEGHGIHIESNLIQNIGTLKAIGGYGNYTYGLVVIASATFFDTIIVSREGYAASIYVYASTLDDRLKLKDTSTLNLIVDLSKTENTSGFLVSNREIEIESGAKLEVLLNNSLNFGINNPPIKMLFMQTETEIIGTYTLENTVTMSYKLSKEKNEREYYLTISRIHTPPGALTNAKSDGNKNIMLGDIAFTDTIYNFFINSENSKHEEYYSILSAIDSSTSIEEALTAIRASSPLNGLDYLIWQDVTMKNISYSQNALLKLIYSTDSSIHISAAPKVEFGSYADVKVFGFGGSLEVAYGINDFSVGLEAKAISLRTTSDFSDSKGVYASGMIIAGYKFNIGSFAPQLALNFGYTYNNMSLSREDSMDEKYAADTNQNIINLGLTLGNKFKVTSSFSITGHLGINYSYLNFAGYEENNKSGTSITVEGSKKHSLRPYLWASLDYEIGKFMITGNATCSVEVLSTKSVEVLSWKSGGYTFNYSGSETEDSRFSFGAGLKGAYKISDIYQVDLGYSFYMHGSYTSHEITLNLGVRF